MTAAATPPTTMNGLRTRNRSEITPTRITAAALKPQFQLPSASALCTDIPHAVVHRHHELVTQAGRQLPQPDQRDQEDHESGDAADDVLVRPVPGVSLHGHAGLHRPTV